MSTFNVKIHNHDFDVEADSFHISEGLVIFTKDMPRGSARSVAGFPLTVVHRILPKE